MKTKEYGLPGALEDDSESYYNEYKHTLREKKQLEELIEK